MARYIDADKLKERLEIISVVAEDLYGMGINRGLDRAETEIDLLSTEDVVPKGEFDLYKKQVDELEDELASTYDKLENAKAEVAREIFEEIEKFTYRYLNDADYSGGDLIYDIVELKEKYTKGG